MESIKKKMTTPPWCAPYADIRTDSYVMLASLVGQAPSAELLHVIRNLAWNEGVPAKLAVSLQALRQAGHDAPPDVLEAEFNRLFVGLGRGELLPYASWYRERKIQSLPLAFLRTDLMRLGVVRQTGCPESEDHAGALCEIMALVSLEESRVPPPEQAEFFLKHLVPWMITFFRDLQTAASMNFYRMVGKFGESFLIAEEEYLQCAGDQIPLNDGGLHHEQRTFQ